MISMVGMVSLRTLFEIRCKKCLDDVDKGQMHCGNRRTISGHVGLYE